MPIKTRSKRLVLLGGEPAIQLSLLALLHDHPSLQAEIWTLRQMNGNAATPDLFLVTTGQVSLVQELRARYPTARIVARVPSEKEEFWANTGADVLVDRLANFEVILRSLERCLEA